MNKAISVGFSDEALHEQAALLASQLSLAVNNETLPRLCVTSDKLVLLAEGFLPLCADFSAAAWQKRRDAGKKQGLIRACKPVKGMRILDATAGWGRDAAILAGFGANVLMIERNPVMAALLADALARLSPQSPLTALLSLQCTDARHYLQNVPADDAPDVIYIDPMHPHRQKSALVKKDMQVLQQLLGAEDDAESLIQLAVKHARQRVVVKWPQRLPALLPPDMSITGKTVRFDVYTHRT